GGSRARPYGSLGRRGPRGPRKIPAPAGGPRRSPAGGAPAAGRTQRRSDAAAPRREPLHRLPRALGSLRLGLRRDDDARAGGHRVVVRRGTAAARGAGGRPPAADRGLMIALRESAFTSPNPVRALRADPGLVACATLDALAATVSLTTRVRSSP